MKRKFQILINLFETSEVQLAMNEIEKIPQNDIPFLANLLEINKECLKNVIQGKSNLFMNYIGSLISFLAFAGFSVYFCFKIKKIHKQGKKIV